jgi:death-on-curing protein
VKETIYLTLEECLELHEDMIRLFGGSAGVRDPGLLESALARPRSGYYQTIFEQAAALLQSLVSNHCFVDGNKRMAMGCAYTFLRANGYRIKPMGAEGESFLIDRVIVGKAEIAEIAAWLAARATALGSDWGSVTEKAPAYGKARRGRPAKAKAKR